MKPASFKTAKDYSSPRWAFMRHRLIGQSGSIYLDRWYVLVTPLFSIMFHRIFRPDKQRDLHDHPWSFLSFVLRGAYIEAVPCTHPDVHGDGRSHDYDLREVRWVNFKRAEDRHSIRETSRVPVWTLVFTGPKRRTWGFWIKEKLQGCWECPRCHFVLMKRVFHVPSASVGVDERVRDDEKCPNDGELMLPLETQERWVKWTEYEKLEQP